MQASLCEPEINLFIIVYCMEHLLCGSSLIVLENTSLDSKALSWVSLR